MEHRLVCESSVFFDTPMFNTCCTITLVYHLYINIQYMHTYMYYSYFIHFFPCVFQLSPKNI